MMKLSNYISNVPTFITKLKPWEVCNKANDIVSFLQAQLSDEYVASNGNAIHKTAIVEEGAILKSPCIVGPNCFIASYAYLRNGVWLEGDVILGPSCEIKSSFIFSGSKAAHFNFIGDSIIGRNVNIEAGAIIANYRNEMDDKEIVCVIEDKKVKTGRDKFGSLIGDGCKIGANSVLAPGTILLPNTTIKRLTLIDQAN